MTTELTVSQEIEKLERQLEHLRHRALLELKVKLAEARHAVSILEKRIENFANEPLPAAALAAAGPEAGEARAAKPRKARVSVTIEQVVEAIRKGARNYRGVAEALGCSPLTVTRKVETEGKAAGIRSSGQKAAFRLYLK